MEFDGEFVNNEMNDGYFGQRKNGLRHGKNIKEILLMINMMVKVYFISLMVIII